MLPVHPLVEVGAVESDGVAGEGDIFRDGRRLGVQDLGPGRLGAEDGRGGKRQEEGKENSSHEGRLRWYR